MYLENSEKGNLRGLEELQLVTTSNWLDDEVSGGGKGGKGKREDSRGETRF